MLNAAIVGFGLSGRVFHAPLLSASEDFHLSTIVSSQQQAIAELYPDAKTASFEAVLADPAIDLVVIATPNDLHAPFAQQALLAGKHVVVEKPVAIQSEECQVLAELAEQQQRCLSIFHNRRWDGDFQTITQLLDEQKLGQLHTYKAHFHRYRPQVKQRWKEQDSAGGGVLYDLGAHLLDQALCLFGLPERLSAQVKALRSGAQAPDFFDIQLYYPGLNVQLSCNSLVVEPGPRYELHGALGSYAKWGTDPQESQLAAGQSPKAKHFGKDVQRSECHLANKALVHQKMQRGNYPAFYQNVAAAIRGEAPLEVTIEQARLVIYLIELAMQSEAEGGRPLAVAKPA
ncbi:Gfo/Idh/MocA family oxidoreductase [Aliagarivorans marinus]|uniref:Gfo/Idh/MocA family oxidoreductase n=1 Tax=Aliagarivorans marinus TaxID=561965 RepID=UPI0003FF03DB|nr:Gfo/Idh/MocA family oxidoreductase [Aliagarivorans marinus]